jgi:hypothetical protein
VVGLGLGLELRVRVRGNLDFDLTGSVCVGLSFHGRHYANLNPTLTLTWEPYSMG